MQFQIVVGEEKQQNSIAEDSIIYFFGNWVNEFMRWDVFHIKSLFFNTLLIFFQDVINYKRKNLIF